MSTREASIATRRLGLGARPGDLKRIASDPRGYVASQLAKPELAHLDHPDLHPSHAVLAAAQRARQEMRRNLDTEMAKAKDLKPGPDGKPLPPIPPGAIREQLDAKMREQLATKPGAVRREAFLEEIGARIDRAVSTDTPFLERLVYFWSNHFCVSVLKGPVRGIAGAYEREAIRPHVLGRFSDMLQAVVQHPAMLIYLDNQVSIGPKSKAGLNRGRGLNENLAREILELHTLGVDGGYTQADVTSFAAVLTGWTVGGINQPQTEPGRFFFAAIRHEPGPQTVLGKRYPDQGKSTGDAVLADLARHPSTARHIAQKLVRHFVSDTPPDGAVARLASVFLKTDGDLAAVTRELLQIPAIWSLPPAKVAPPFDFVTSLVRGFGVKPRMPELVRLAAALGQPAWAVPSPKGWPDDDDAWMGPAAIRERLRIAERLAQRMDKFTDPRALAEDLIGGVLSPETRQAIAWAESREQGFELLVMAPEFLRR